MRAAAFLVSACLLGRPCRYDGRAKPARRDVLTLIERLESAGFAKLVCCPECAGGLATPRAPAEIEAGKNAGDVLRGNARVLTAQSVDVTPAYVAGARATLAACRRTPVAFALLKSRSPSCGKGLVYDGTFSGTLVPGSGITAELLQQHGIRVLTEEEVDALDRLVRDLAKPSGNLP